MASRTKYIGYGGTASIIGLILFFSSSLYFDTELEGNINCDGNLGDPCEWHYNVTLKYLDSYYIYNPDAIDLVFEPSIKKLYHCKKDNRNTASWRNDRYLAPCGVGWREFTWKDPLTPRYKYIEKFTKGKKHKYKTVIFKFNPEDKIKFGGKLIKEEFDPYLLPKDNPKNSYSEKFIDNVNISELQKCDIEYYAEPVFKLVDEIQDVHGFCINYVNLTSSQCSNETGPNTSCSNISYSYNNSFRCITGTEIVKVNISVGEVTKSKEKNCRIIEYSFKGKTLICPENHRCDRIENKICVLNCDDGDCNYKSNYVKDTSWTSRCFDVRDMPTGNFKINDNKKPVLKIE